MAWINVSRLPFSSLPRSPPPPTPAPYLTLLYPTPTQLVTNNKHWLRQRTLQLDHYLLTHSNTNCLLLLLFFIAIYALPQLSSCFAHHPHCFLRRLRIRVLPRQHDTAWPPHDASRLPLFLSPSSSRPRASDASRRGEGGHPLIFILHQDFGSLNTTLMSVEIRTSLNCLRHPSRFMPVSRTQLSKVHTGDSIQNISKSVSPTVLAPLLAPPSKGIDRALTERPHSRIPIKNTVGPSKQLQSQSVTTNCPSWSVVIVPSPTSRSADPWSP